MSGASSVLMKYIDTLYNELSKGIESIKKGDVYTINEAWEEIDKI